MKGREGKRNATSSGMKDKKGEAKFETVQQHCLAGFDSEGLPS